MKKWFLLVAGLFCCASFAWAGFGYKVQTTISVTVEEASSCDIDIATFEFANLTGWTQDNGTWYVSSGIAYSSPAYQNNFIRNDTTVGATNQWVKLQINDLRNTDSAGSGILLRATGATGYRYVARFGGTDGANNTKFTVYSATVEDQVIEQSTAITWEDGDYIGARISGTGDATVLEIWENPTGDPDCPDNWGTADITFSGNPTNPANTGTYVGMFQRNGSASDYLDNFSAGGE